MIHTTSNKIKGSSASGKIYLYGNKYIKDSLMMNRENNMFVFEERIEGLWQPASILSGANSIWVGHNVGLAGIGHHLATESPDGHYHFHAHSEYDGETSITDAQILNIYQYTERLVYQPDESGNWTGTIYEFISPAPAHTLVTKGYLKTHTTAASEPVHIQTWVGTDDTGAKIFDQWYPASNFPALSEIDIEYSGGLEFETGNNYFTRYSSEENFSMKMNASNTFPWVAADMGMVREDNLLQTTPYVDGDTFTEGQYLIYNRKIYICNTTGVQTGTFLDNFEKWNIISTNIYSWEKVEINTGIRIPENHQMTVHDAFNLEGTLLLEGSLVLRK